MEVYECWFPDEGEIRDDQEGVYTFSFEDAAETAARERCEVASELCERVVCVANGEDIRWFRVQFDMEPVFRASEMDPVEAS